LFYWFTRFAETVARIVDLGGLPASQHTRHLVASQREASAAQGNREGPMRVREGVGAAEGAEVGAAVGAEVGAAVGGEVA
jgi:hypothetical protein